MGISHQRRRRSAFSLIELIVVIVLIVGILAIAIPGMTKLNADARLSSAYQAINSAMTRAYCLALAQRSMTAVRFMPGIWDVDPNSANPNAPVNPTETRQHMVLYRYVGSAIDPVTFQVRFGEYFDRVPDLHAAILPEDVWVAPIEALQQTQGRHVRTDGMAIQDMNLGADFVLKGQTGAFRYNADPFFNANFLNADDFLIVVDPDAGIRNSLPMPYQLRAYAPPVGYEVDSDPAVVGPNGYYQRYSFSGVVAYRRQQLLALGRDGTQPNARMDWQNYLKASGRPYLAHRYSGGLTLSSEHPQ